ncbi:ATP-binding protein [Roseomonas harenae]|uniref:ATP-binding protein n=1 Tax=Muricoccus harenae TaxID=2692566 RepID=UPI0038B48C70
MRRRWWVADHGRGVPETERKNAFRRHRQARDVHRRGHGLGLSTAERIEHAHGGVADVGAAPWGGGAFSLHLPWPRHWWAPRSRPGPRSSPAPQGVPARISPVPHDL